MIYQIHITKFNQEETEVIFCYGGKEAAELTVQLSKCINIYKVETIINETGELVLAFKDGVLTYCI